MSIDLSEANLNYLMENPPAPPSTGGYDGLTDGDKTWWQSFWEGQTTLSPETNASWKALLEQFKTCGPWGQAYELSHYSSDTPLRQTLPDGFMMPKRNASGLADGHISVAGLKDTSKISSTCLVGDSTWGSHNPWFTTNPDDNTVNYWMGGFRKVLRAFLWLCCCIGVVVWMKGRVTV
jgi:hypothetical protein